MEPQLVLALRRVVVLVQRHMRRYATRLVDAKDSYTDNVVGRGEVRAILGLAQADSRWVDELGIPDAGTLLGQQTRLEEEALAARVGSALDSLRVGFGLSDLELDLLVVAAAPRISLELARLYPVAWADFAVKQPTAGFLAELVALAQHTDPEAVVRTIEDDAPLVRWRLVVPRDNPMWLPDTPRLHSYLEVPERVLQVMRGVAPSAGLGTTATLHPRHEALALGDVVLEEPVRAALLAALLQPTARVLITGPRGVGRRSAVHAIVADRALLEIRFGEVMAKDGESPPLALASILREAQLQRALPLLRIDSELPARAAAYLPELVELVRAYPGPLVITQGAGDSLGARLVPGIKRIDMGFASPAGQERLWTDRLVGYLGPDRGREVARELARGQRLTVAAMDRAITTVLANSSGRRAHQRLNAGELLRESRRGLDHELGALADVVHSTLRLADVVLPSDVHTKVREVLAYARNADTVHEAWGFGEKSPYGHGLGVLFSGPPGTGKTLLASALAAELGRVLYRVDLSRIVDKYIGETEKNLGRVFDEARRAHAVLLFDEADSLFAKRTDIKSSNDRYANLEVNYLLQRLENYEGVSVLTTNLATSLDEAFQRRLRFRIAIPMPEPEQRADLWKKLAPPRAPLATDIDWAYLGETFPISGGHIKNAVLRAAVIAADQSRPIDHLLLVSAGREECREMGMAVREL